MLALPSKFYAPENVRLTKYVQSFGTVIALVLCGYLGIQCAVALSRVSESKSLLRKTKTEAVNLARELAQKRETETRRTPPSPGGVDFFAVKFDEWARQELVRIESFVPEGAPVAAEIEVDGVKLGIWNAFKVRAKGSGEYEQVIRLLNRFRHSDLPVKLDSFALHANSGSGRPIIGFDLVITVYEKKEQTSGVSSANRS